MTLLVGRTNDGTASSGRGDSAKALRAYSLSSSSSSGTDECLPPTLRLNFVIIFSSGRSCRGGGSEQAGERTTRRISPATMNAYKRRKINFQFPRIVEIGEFYQFPTILCLFCKCKESLRFGPNSVKYGDISLKICRWRDNLTRNLQLHERTIILVNSSGPGIHSLI